MAQICASPLRAYVASPFLGAELPRRTAKSLFLFGTSRSVQLAHRSQKLVAVSALGNTDDKSKAAEECDAGFASQIQDLLLTSSALITPILLAAEPANAVGGEFGILEGRSAALIHPIVMASLFLYTLYAGYLGWQWRRVRTIANDITELKKQIPEPAEGTPVSPLQAEVEKLSEERKELVKGGFKDKHFNAGSILLGGGVLISVGGCLNTWARTGKLFPGPHLFAGAAITVLWALAAALVPAMQKGDENARSAHIALNAVNVLLFVWQIPTGIDIVFKVFQFTSWP